MKLVAISGSLDRESSNSALLEAATSLDLGIGYDVWDELGDLPLFRPREEGDDHVRSLRRALADADAVLIATPEYAGGMPGSLKNALDWVVGSGELYEKQVVVISAAPSAERGGNARRWVEEVARMQGAAVVDSFTVAIQRSDPPSAMVDRSREALGRALAALGGGHPAHPSGVGRSHEDGSPPSGVT